jgi:GT2 family glycosyltransferase
MYKIPNSSSGNSFRLSSELQRELVLQLLGHYSRLRRRTRRKKREASKFLDFRLGQPQTLAGAVRARGKSLILTTVRQCKRRVAKGSLLEKFLVGALGIGAQVPPIRQVIKSREGKRSKLFEFWHESGLFDADWYVASNADIRDGNMDAALHYLLYGAAEGRNPSAGFDTIWYLNAYPDVVESGMNPLSHYLLHGKAEGRRPLRTSKIDGGCGLSFSGLEIPFSPLSLNNTDAPNCLFIVDTRKSSAPDVLVDYLRILPSNSKVVWLVGGSLSSDEHEKIFSSVRRTNSQSEFIGLGIDGGALEATQRVSEMLEAADAVFFFDSSIGSPNTHTEFQLELHSTLGSELSIICIADFMRKVEACGMLLPDSDQKSEFVVPVDQRQRSGEVFSLQKDVRDALEHPHPVVRSNSFWVNPAIWRDDSEIRKYVVDVLLGDNDCSFILQVLLLQAGFDRVQIRSNTKFQGRFKFDAVRPYFTDGASSMAARVFEYQQKKKRDNTVVVYTAIAGEYDSLLLPEVLDPAIDYVCFSDTPRTGFGVFDIRPIDTFNIDPAKIGRYIKTHPHVFLNEYEVSIWVDSSILIRGDLLKYVEAVQHQAVFGAVKHPIRSTIRQEFEECVKRGKDTTDVLVQQIDRYGDFCDQEGMLIESGFFVAFHRSPELKAAFALWWAEINKFSRRDQISFGYAFDRAGVPWSSLLPESSSVRNHPDFALFDHGALSGFSWPREFVDSQELCDPYDGESFQALRAARLGIIRARSIDIVVCVHNALDDVRVCLESVRSHLLENHSIIIVDDCSGEETRLYLESFTRESERVTLIRSDEPLRYTKAANTGLRASSADLVILLNSDTIVNADWALKLAEVAYSRPFTGIVGPISNAASSQSIPDTKSSATQTAINPLPEGRSIADIDTFLEEQTVAGIYPTVPLVHGFCFAVRREVFDKIGYLDEEHFPRGYGEENDFCFRAADAGFDLRIATHTFVFHAKSKSYPTEERIALMQESKQTLRALHSKERIISAIQSIENHPLLVTLREKAAAYYGYGAESEAPSEAEARIAS